MMYVIKAPFFPLLCHSELRLFREARAGYLSEKGSVVFGCKYLGDAMIGYILLVTDSPVCNYQHAAGED
jgi:hypothetical protein